MKLRWHHEAVVEYAGILAEAERRDPLEYANIQRQVLSTLATVRIFKKSGRFNPSIECYEKYVPHTRVVLIYQVKGDELIIISVFHTSRNPKEKQFGRN